MMSDKFTFFCATAQYGFLRLLPGKRQAFAEYLDALSGNVPEEIFCQDVLEIWAENWGGEGLLLGSIALFLAGMILMVAADLLICHLQNRTADYILRVLSGLFCLGKFRCGSKRPLQNLLVLLFIGTAIVSGFFWWLTMAFLILFTVGAAWAGRGKREC